MSRSSAPSPHPIIEIGVAFWQSKALLSAVELGVFGALADGPMTAGQLSRELGLRSRGARDFFDILVASGLLDRDEAGYRLTPLAAEYLDPGRPATDISGYLSFLNAGFPWWSRLSEGLRSGDRLDFSEALASEGAGAPGGRGTLVAPDPEADTFGEAFAEPGQVRGFLRAMTGYSMGANRALVHAFDWAAARTVVDVGCAEGSLLGHLAAAWPHLNCVGFDLPQVKAGFEEHLKDAAGVTFQPGDFFNDPLPEADVIVFGHVLHDWPVETRKMLLRKAYEALAPGGTVLVYESLVDDDRRAGLIGLMISLNVSLVSNGGSGYTAAECHEWLREAGFTGTEVSHLDGPEYLVAGTR
ncbi:acetylserotonin O-methyltransferase [Amycolatopsis sp. NBC_00345]|uniref:methyltransferase n=1 Tax=Amycolatopsis sp. NBC_00345 TaxID=2975955 RepID=UPI002E2578BB